ALANFRLTTTRSFSLAGIAEAEYALGHRSASQRALGQLIDLQCCSWLVAHVYAVRGAKDQAFEALEHAYAQRDPGGAWIKIDAALNVLGDDIRYGALVRKMNSPK